MEEIKKENQKRVEQYKELLSTNSSVSKLSTIYNKTIKEVLREVEKFTIILYYRSGYIKEIKHDFLDTNTNVNIVCSLKFGK